MYLLTVVSPVYLIITGICTQHMRAFGMLAKSKQDHIVLPSAIYRRVRDLMLRVTLSRTSNNMRSRGKGITGSLYMLAITDLAFHSSYILGKRGPGGIKMLL